MKCLATVNVFLIAGRDVGYLSLTGGGFHAKRYLPSYKLVHTF